MVGGGGYGRILLFILTSGSGLGWFLLLPFCSVILLPVSWFDGLARILSCVEDSGIWPEGCLMLVLL